MRFRSFKRGTVSLCRSKDCKVASLQSLRSEKKFAARHTTHHMQVRVLNEGNILKDWPTARPTATLQPFDLQRPTVPLWKNLDPVVNIISDQRAGSIFKMAFALSKWPHLHGVYSVGVFTVFSLTIRLTHQKNSRASEQPYCRRHKVKNSMRSNKLEWKNRKNEYRPERSTYIIWYNA